MGTSARTCDSCAWRARCRGGGAAREPAARAAGAAAASAAPATPSTPACCCTPPCAARATAPPPATPTGTPTFTLYMRKQKTAKYRNVIKELVYNVG